MKYVMQTREWDSIVDALSGRGHERVEKLEDADFLVFNGVPGEFPESLPDNIRFVQLCLAGIDAFFDAGYIDASRRWANASGVYGRPVAESAVALLLSALHMHVQVARERSFDTAPAVHEGTGWLFGSTIAVIGAGGIGRDLIPMLAGFGCEVIAVNNSGRPVEGAVETVTAQHTEDVLRRADHVILAAPLTEDTRGMINTRTLGLMKDTAVLVNVGRGPLVVTDDLVEALRWGQLRAAGLDVTDPEPLPDDHPLWGLDNVVITPHTANTFESMQRLMPDAVLANLDALEAGDRMPTEVDPKQGY
ncbi:D-isomer specific 2-hydroxyacid dehydrogenase family protein [Corynebacterium sp. P5848]|uniref:D-isomer specific 2-hydroxyacid dehydrogenase family protein n=1 Tax=Corynebacterium marambiense TaxID=2765364 RepID=UPI002260E33A|nr:D-isomer specific 2-hydroxyacid dehydrogenase family protein [Corynebacterium marambiense]MCX7543346.1 D-isomer specific 2-hydroxyacid dehydrogenase family protein [Corynebacterium marambiense]